MIIEYYECADIKYEITIGKNATENWNIISNSSQNDVWFHLEGMASPHVVLKNYRNDKIKDIPKCVIIRCAYLCKENSKYKNIKKVTVIYTQIKNVSKGDTVGSVFTKNTSELVI